MIVLLLMSLFQNSDNIKDTPPQALYYLIGAEFILLDTPIFSVIYWSIQKLVMIKLGL